MENNLTYTYGINSAGKSLPVNVKNGTETGHFSLPASTGKERDEETGYGYFGTRYMDHELITMWLSVDPMADKYPSISPYAYCAWNPVKLVDPNGEEIVISAEDWKILDFTLTQVLGKDHPFFYDASTGKVGYDESKMDNFKFSNKTDISQYQSDILEHYKELICNRTFTATVRVIGNDDIFHAIVDDVEGDYSLNGINANGFCQLSQDGSGCMVYVSSVPLDMKKKKYLQWEDHRAVAMNHELGGHAYYYMIGLRGKENNRETTNYDNAYRKSFGKGAHGSGYVIRWSEAIHHKDE